MVDEPESNLHWKAFLYVSGDLPPGEASDFERLLLEDQGAREAVALAVELIETVTSVGVEPILPLKRPGLVAWPFAVAAAAAILLIVLIPALRSIGPAEPDASEVARSWSGIRRGMDAEWSDLVAGPHSSEPADSPLGVDPELAEPATERPLPSWLLSAASSPRGESAREEN